MRKIYWMGAAAFLTAACAPATRANVTTSAPAASQPPAPPAPSAEAKPATAEAPNPLLPEWKGPYGGVPPFSQVKVELIKPAFEEAMKRKRAEIASIADIDAGPTFENTIAALEVAGSTFDDVEVIYSVWSSTMSGPEFQALEREMEPKLAAFEDEITQNEKLFGRIEAVYASPDKAKLTPEQQRLSWRYHMRFVRAGAKLDVASKKRLSEINQRLALLFATFSQNVLADEESHAVILEQEADLAGLPDSVRASAAAAAEARGQKGKWAVINTRSSADPFLTYSSRDDLREQVWRNFVNRGDNGDAHDNNAVITEILKLRAQRATLLGYASHAHWRLEDSMAKTPERALSLMQSVWGPAVARVREEVADMQAIAKKEGAKRAIAPWDYRYYAEKVRKAKYDLDQNDVKPYLQLDKMRDAMMWAAGQLYGFSFAQITDGSVPVYHPDVRVWEVTDSKGRHVGLWYFDPYARPGKNSGAWASPYRRQSRLDEEV